MKHEEAKSVFRGKDKLNCAQAVLKAFQSEADISEQAIKDAKSAGSGKAEGQACGALYAALLIADSEDKRDKLREDFQARAGSLKCKEIRKLKQLPCRECVGVAAELLEKLL